MHGTSYTVTRGRILERNPDSYSQPHALRISISSNSRNLLQLLQFITDIVKDTRGKRDRKLYPLPYGLRNPYRNLKSELSRLRPETSTKLFVHEFIFWPKTGLRCIYILQRRLLQNTEERKKYFLPSFLSGITFSALRPCIAYSYGRCRGALESYKSAANSTYRI